MLLGIDTEHVFPSIFLLLVCVLITTTSESSLPMQSSTLWLRCWIPNPVVPCSKTLGGFKVDSVFHPSEVN